MLKKILYTILFIVLAAGSAYCWKKVDFNRKTAMFFQVVFGGENSMGGPGGRPMGENRGGDMSQFGAPTNQAQSPDFQGAPSGPPGMEEGGERGAMPDFGQAERGGERGAPPDFGQGERGARPPGNGGGGPGGKISLGEVARYMVIMAFFVMLARLLDRLFLRFSRSRKPA